MRSIFSSAARCGKAQAKGKVLQLRRELKIHWAKPPAGCRLWGLYVEREFQSWQNTLLAVIGDDSVECVHELRRARRGKMGGAWLIAR